MKKFLTVAICLISAIYAYAQDEKDEEEEIITTTSPSATTYPIVESSPASEESTSAQFTSPTEFEGEILYETYERYSDKVMEQQGSVYVNGVHKYKLIVKGSKMHCVDLTTKYHNIYDASQPQMIFYSEHTNSGVDISHPIMFNQIWLLKPGSIHVTIAGTTAYSAELTSNTFAPTTTTKTILGQECTLNKGQIVRKDNSSQTLTYDVQAYTANNILAPSGYSYNVYGLNIQNIALKWIMNNVIVSPHGELQTYIEADVTQITPRTVDDSEFDIPSNVTIAVFKNALSSRALMNVYKSIRNIYLNNGIAGGDISEKTTGVHIYDNDEWKL